MEKIKGSYEEFASEYKGQFVYENCSFWEEFNKKVEGDLLDSTADLLDAAVGQERFLKYLKTKLLISPVSTTEFQSWAEVARLLDIPAILTPQKMLVAPSDEIAGIEERYIGRAQVTDTFANVAVQSPLVAEYLEWARYKGNRIETGNLIFARINGKKRKEKREAFYKEIGGIKKTIVWAPSMKTRKSRRFYVIETIDELTAAMEEVFDIVAQMEDVHLVFRIHPGDAITKDEIYALLQVPSNVSVSDSGTFEDVLAVGDLMISFSSTAIQESLINHTPVLLYDKWKRYNHLDAQKVGHSGPTEISSVYYINEKENLESGIRWILEKQAGTDVPPEIFKDYIFMEDKFSNFIDFVDKCLNV